MLAIPPLLSSGFPHLPHLPSILSWQCPPAPEDLADPIPPWLPVNPKFAVSPQARGLYSFTSTWFAASMPGLARRCLTAFPGGSRLISLRGRPSSVQLRSPRSPNSPPTPPPSPPLPFFPYPLCPCLCDLSSIFHTHKVFPTRDVQMPDSKHPSLMALSYPWTQ